MDSGNFLRQALYGKYEKNGQERLVLAQHAMSILIEQDMVQELVEDSPRTRDALQVLFYALSFLYPGEREDKLRELLHTNNLTITLQASDAVDLFHCIAGFAGEPYRVTKTLATLCYAEQPTTALMALWAILEAYVDIPVWMYPPKKDTEGTFGECKNYRMYLDVLRSYLNINHPEVEGS